MIGLIWLTCWPIWLVVHTNSFQCQPDLISVINSLITQLLDVYRRMSSCCDLLVQDSSIHYKIFLLNLMWVRDLWQWAGKHTWTVADTYTSTHWDNKGQQTHNPHVMYIETYTLSTDLLSKTRKEGTWWCWCAPGYQLFFRNFTYCIAYFVNAFFFH